MFGVVTAVRFDPASRAFMERGFYAARRVSWVPNSGWVMVMVREPFNDPNGELRVFEPGVVKTDPLGKWVFLFKINGLQDLNDDGEPMRPKLYAADPVRGPLSAIC